MPRFPVSQTLNLDALNQELRYQYLLHQADNTLILSHRLSEWCGHGPVLEQDIALTNIALDLLGQSRLLLSLAAELAGKGQAEDDLAYLRGERDFRNVLLVEQPNTDFAYTLARQFYFDVFSTLLYEAWAAGPDEQLAAIAAKAVKETRYHARFSSEWVVRLGDGTAVSHQKMQAAIDDLWPYTGEMFMPSEAEKAAFEAGIGPDTAALFNPWKQRIHAVLYQATLHFPSENSWMHRGGKQGVHSEHLGYLLAEMQYLQRTHPGAIW